MIAMKHYFLPLCLILFSYAVAFAQHEITDYDVTLLEYTPVGDPDFDWSQFKEKNSKAILNGNGLEIESKDEDLVVTSVSEFPINITSEDFLVSLKMEPGSVDDKKPFGIVYDYKNEDNFKGMLILKKGFQLVEFEDGKPSVIKKGLYKGKNKEFILSIMRSKNKLHFGINGINLSSLSNVELTYPVFGFILTSKGKLIGKSATYKKRQPKEHEED